MAAIERSRRVDGGGALDVGNEESVDTMADELAHRPTVVDDAVVPQGQRLGDAEGERLVKADEVE